MAFRHLLKQVKQELDTSHKFEKVTFTWPYGCRHLAMIAGSWADWNPQVMFPEPIEPHHPFEIWKATFKLPKDHLYCYRFIIDGEWKYDGNQPAKFNPMIGEYENILKIGFVLSVDTMPISMVAHVVRSF